MHFDAEGRGVGGKGGVENEELESFHAQLSLHDEFAGGPPNIAAAENLLRTTSMWSDPNMQTLLTMRSNATNPLQNRKLVINLSNEAKYNLAVAVRLKIPPCLKLSAQYVKVIDKKHDFTLTVRVSF